MLTVKLHSVDDERIILNYNGLKARKIQSLSTVTMHNSIYINISYS